MPAPLLINSGSLGLMQAPVFKPRPHIPDLSPLFAVNSQVKDLQDKWDTLNEKMKPDLAEYLQKLSPFLKGNPSDVQEKIAQVFIPLQDTVDRLTKKYNGQYYAMVNDPEFKSAWRAANNFGLIQADLASKQEQTHASQEQIISKQTGENIDLYNLLNPYHSQIDPSGKYLKPMNLNESVQNRINTVPGSRYPDFEASVGSYDNFTQMNHDFAQLFAAIQGDKSVNTSDLQLITNNPTIGSVLSQTQRTYESNAEKVNKMVEQLLNGSMLSKSQENTLKSQYIRQRLMENDGTISASTYRNMVTSGQTGLQFSDDFEQNYKNWKEQYLKGLASPFKNVTSMVDVNQSVPSGGGSSSSGGGLNIYSWLGATGGEVQYNKNPLQVAVPGQNKAIDVPIGYTTSFQLPDYSKKVQYQNFETGPALFNNHPVYIPANMADQMFILNANNRLMIAPKLNTREWPESAKMTDQYKQPEWYTEFNIQTDASGNIADPRAYADYEVLTTGSNLLDMQQQGFFMKQRAGDDVWAYNPSVINQKYQLDSEELGKGYSITPVDKDQLTVIKNGLKAKVENGSAGPQDQKLYDYLSSDDHEDEKYFKIRIQRDASEALFQMGTTTSGDHRTDIPQK